MLGNFKSSLNKYLSATRTATYGFLAALPLFVAYELIVLRANPVRGPAIRVGADIWIKQILSTIGGREHLSLGLMAFLLGVIICLFERKKKIKITPHYFYWMFLESFLYSVFLAVVISGIVSKLFVTNIWLVLVELETNPLQSGENMWLNVALSLGAGLYEELFFRVLLVSGLFLGLKKFLFAKEVTSNVIAVIIGALIFSWVHYIGPFGDVLTLPSFTFRFLFGVALNVLYVVRGFGIAAWSHAIYDLLVMVVLPR